jgi:hypothetical protein
VTETRGELFARALAAKDRDLLCRLLADHIDFRGMTPQRLWEGTTPAEVVDGIVLGHWFEAADHIQELCSVASGKLADREHVAYRLRVRNAEGEFLVEQQAYYRVTGGRIDWMRVLCSGYRPVPTTSLAG